ncbi:hypothetical protein [Methylomonas rapida]|uniref:Ig-like domain-containing protein n=1 Tax=Methylomonas rapida TaxID=2963939 RepID=A0ABY7GPV5_9GAMM|nr:hypothetical protein [Methylomonas rapida]WAR46539.1 hypothetical protein NM686_008485 [Methylomonas rapida]
MITTVVIAVGLLAVASLQGNLIGSSRDNKTRAEAKALADAKIEQLRDTVVKTGFDALASSTAAESIGGVTETFSRTWTVTNQTSPARKQVSVNVCWPAGACSDNVAVQSVLVYDDVGNAAKNLKDAQSGLSLAGGPSTNAESSDEITETKTLPDGEPGSYVQDPDNENKIWIREDSRTKGTGAYLCSTLGLSAFENGLYTRRTNHDGVTGNEAIELYEQVTFDSTNYCIPRIRFNGGVIIPIRGIVHSGATSKQGNTTTYLDVDLFTFNASETGAYCIFKPADGAKSAPYVCYVGGNCSGFVCTDTTPSTCDDADVTKCPNGAYASAKVGPGGWRGKVGLLGVAGSSNNFRNVCFQEEIASSPASLDTARNYYALRNNINEGINKPYSCHDFLIINGQSTNPKIHDECVKQAEAIGGFTLASKNIQRTISSGANLYDPTIDTSFCTGTTGTAYSITGEITGAASTPTVTVTDGSTTQTCTVTSSSYTCAITTSASSVNISGIYNSQAQSCNLALTTSVTSPTGCSLAFITMPTYTITGVIRAASAAAVTALSLEIQDGDKVIPCPDRTVFNGTSSTYTCTVATNNTSISIHASVTGGYTVSPSNYTISSLSGTGGSVVVPSPDNDFIVAAVSTYTVSGSISLGNNVDNLTSVTVNAANPAGVGCTITPPSGGWKKNKSGTYSCSIYGGSNSITLAISPTCSNSNPAKRYSLSASGATQVQPGQLVIDLGTVNGPQTKDISITESNTGC